MVGLHSVVVYPDRAAGTWSAPIASNPYMATDGAGWRTDPFGPVFTWSAGGMQVPGASKLNRSDTSPVPRIAGALKYRVRVAVTLSQPNSVWWYLHYGKTADAAWKGPYWDPANATQQWAARDLPAGSHTVESVFDAAAIDPVYGFLGPAVQFSVDVGPNRVESIELAYIGGTSAVDLSCLVDTVTIHHGRDDPGSQPEASTASVEFTATPTDPLPVDVEIGATLVVATQTDRSLSQRFVGRITDIALGWDNQGPDTPESGVGQLVAAGFLADLGRRVVGDIPWPQELDGARVARIMAAAGVTLDPAWSDPGSVNLLARDVDSQAALETADAAAQSAGGVVWSTRDGEIRYADAYHRKNASPALTLDACDVLVTPTWRRTLEGLVNDVSIGYGVTPDGGEQPRYTESNAASITKYGSYEYTTATELAAAADAQAMARLLLARNSSPVWILAALPVDTIGLDAERYDTALSLDMHSLVILTGLPAIGMAPTTAALWVEGWRETLTYGTHDLELVVSGYCRTAPAPTWDSTNPSWTWDTVPSEMTWDDAACFGPPVNLGRWDDVAATLRWDQVPAATTWNTWKG